MWNKISSLGNVVADFTKEVITANSDNEEEEDEEFYDGESVTPRTPRKTPNHEEHNRNNNSLFQTKPISHTSSSSDNTDPFFSDDFDQSSNHHDHHDHQMKNNESSSLTSHHQVGSILSSAETDTEEAFWKQMEKKYAEEHRENEQKVLQLENRVREKEFLISRLERQLLERNKSSTVTSPLVEVDINIDHSSEKIQECTQVVYDQLQQQLFSLLKLDDQIEKENDVSVLLMDQSELMIKWCELFDDSVSQLNEKLSHSLLVDGSSDNERKKTGENGDENGMFVSNKNETSFASDLLNGNESQELNQLCNDFRIMLSNYNNHAVPSSPLSTSVGNGGDDDDVKNQLIEIMMSSKTLLSEQQQRLLEHESSQRKMQRVTKDSVEKFRLLYNSIVQLCKSNHIGNHETFVTLGDVDTKDQQHHLDSVKLKDIMQMSKSLEAHVKASGSSLDACSQASASLHQLLVNGKEKLPRVSSDMSAPQSLLVYVSAVEHYTKKLFDTNNQVISRLQHLQQKQMEDMDKSAAKDSDLKKKLNQMAQQHEQQMRKSTEKIDSLNREMLQLDRENKRLKSELHSLSSNAKMSTEELEYHKEEHDYEKKELESRIAELENELYLIRERDNEHEAKQKQLTNEISILNSKSSSYLEELRQKEEALSNLELALESLQSESTRNVRKLKVKLSEAETATKKAEEQAIKALAEKEKIQKLKDQSDAMIAEMKQDNTRSDTLRTQYDAMRTMLEDAIGRANDENLVDRRVINRLLMTLFDPSPSESNHANSLLGSEPISDKRDNKVIALLCSTLRMDAEQQRITTTTLRSMVRGHHETPIANTNSGLGGWFRSRSPNTHLSESSYENKGAEKSLSKLWVQFLIEESSKQPNV